MKTILLIISTALLSFTVNDRKAAVYGVWKGAYGMGNQVEKTWVYLQPHNSLKFYEGEIKPQNKLTGNYTLLGDTAILITCRNKDGKEITMKGNLNKTKNFVDGVWESNDDEYGSFYLQKQAINN